MRPQTLLERLEAPPQKPAPDPWGRVLRVLGWLLSISTGLIAVTALAQGQFGIAGPLVAFALGVNPRTQIPGVVRVGLIVFAIAAS